MSTQEENQTVLDLWEDATPTAESTPSFLPWIVIHGNKFEASIKKGAKRVAQLRLQIQDMREDYAAGKLPPNLANIPVPTTTIKDPELVTLIASNHKDYLRKQHKLSYHLGIKYI
jgi:hypothetical protein